MGAFIKLPAIKEIDSEQNQQAMLCGTHKAKRPISASTETDLLLVGGSAPNPL
jgi:hypothetical protein